MIPKTVLLGDFNLDYGRIYDDNYAHKNLFADFDEILSDYNLIQMVNFVTWSRMIGPNLRSSVLDHAYVKDPCLILQQPNANTVGLESFSIATIFVPLLVQSM